LVLDEHVALYAAELLTVAKYNLQLESAITLECPRYTRGTQRPKRVHPDPSVFSGSRQYSYEFPMTTHMILV